MVVIFTITKYATYAGCKSLLYTFDASVNAVSDRDFIRNYHVFAVCNTK